ncbi:MAG: 23S rRNA (adenine(2503)-C(2))-methyltransferase RlmN [Acidobacteria bacterium]|nr:MAG: 23S rRNA (adenine(2503)-C(2))-methyltransferase RlmN [Acidobacteriota bacterium]GIU83162.1 MAG: dual-specificity RNA methyltransferase RlmN [Pyrinomonadaceae bacterium]
MEKTHLTGLTRAELVEFAERQGEPGWRGKQLFKQIQARRLFSFDEMTDLPKKFRQALREIAVISTLKVESRFVSTDGTRRYLMKTQDGFPVETVFIPSENRDTICFSSQSGCPLKCDFCLTAKLGLLRSLSAGEIVEQILIVLNDVYGVGNETPHGTNLVGMGAGEPFLNFENLVKAIEIICDKEGLSIVPNRITISTAGIVPKIYEFAELKIRPHLAISLSAPTDELRNRLMPINRRWNIETLMQAASFFHEKMRPREKLTFEYVLLKGVNDSENQALELARLLRKYRLKRVKVNLIPHNTAEELDYTPSDETKIERFKAVLESHGIPAYIRRPRGRDIYAACGQLAAKASVSAVSKKLETI